MTQNPELPIAGWYTDPSDTLRIRYWDGQEWTKHVALPEAEMDSQEPLAALIDSYQPMPATNTVVINAVPDEYFDDQDFENLNGRSPRDATIAMFFGAFFVITIVVAAVALITSR